MSTLPWLPLIDPTTYVLDLGPETYTDLLHASGVDYVDDMDGYDDLVGSYALDVTLAEQDVPNLDADLSAIPDLATAFDTSTEDDLYASAESFSADTASATSDFATLAAGNTPGSTGSTGPTAITPPNPTSGSSSAGGYTGSQQFNGVIVANVLDFGTVPLNSAPLTQNFGEYDGSTSTGEGIQSVTFEENDYGVWYVAGYGPKDVGNTPLGYQYVTFALSPTASGYVSAIVKVVLFPGNVSYSIGLKATVQ